MFIFFLILFIIGGFTMIGSILAAQGWPVLIGAIAFVVGFSFMLYYKTSSNDHDHNQALSNLREQGWRIDLKDIHILSNKIDIECLSLPIRKLNGVYYIVRNRTFGGGYAVIPSTDQVLIKEMCN